MAKCARCRMPLMGRKELWCSEACRYTWRRSFGALFACPGCLRLVPVPEDGLATRKFCSRGCARAEYNRAHFQGESNPRWRGGRALSYGPGWKKVREIVRARDGVCRRCGKTPEENGRALDVHHNDPFRFTGDNSLELLEALCRSCHARADDHGRRGSAAFLRKAGRPPRPAKREIRRLKAKLRQAERTARRRALQKRAEQLHREGTSLREIARELGVSHQTVANWLGGRYRLSEAAMPYHAA